MYRSILSVVIPLLMTFVSVSVAEAEPEPTHVQRIGIDPVGDIDAVGTSGDVLAWGHGRQLFVARVLPDRSIEIQGRVLLEAAPSAIAVTPTTIVAKTGRGLSWVDITDPANPEVARVTQWGGGILAADSDHVVSAGGDSVVLWEVAGASDRSTLGSWRAPAAIRDVAMWHDTVAVAHSEGFDIVDFVRPDAPAVVLEWRAFHGAWRIDVEDTIAVATSIEAGLVVVDLALPSGPAVVAELSAGHDYYSRPELVGRTLITQPLAAIDLSDPAAPLVGAPTGIAGEAVASVERTAVVLRGTDLLLVEPVPGPSLEVATTLETGPGASPGAFALTADGTLVVANAGPDGTVLRVLRPSGSEMLDEHTRIELPGGPNAVAAVGAAAIVSHGSVVSAAAPVPGGWVIADQLDVQYHPGLFAAGDDTLWTARRWKPLTAIDARSPADLRVAGLIWVDRRGLGLVQELHAGHDLLLAEVDQYWDQQARVGSWPTWRSQALLVRSGGGEPPQTLWRGTLERKYSDILFVDGDTFFASYRDGSFGRDAGVVVRYRIGATGEPQLVEQLVVEHHCVAMYEYGPAVLCRTGPLTNYDLRFALPYDPSYSRVQYTTPHCPTDHELMVTRWPYMAVQCEDGTVDLYQATEPPS